MRVLFAIVVLAALAWSGWWFYGANLRERVLEGWLAERRAEGWLAEAEDIAVTGFPNRLDAIVTGLALADPESGWSWEAPEFQILSLSYQPHHVIVVWPGEQTVASAYGAAEVAADAFRGSVVFEPSLALPLDRTVLEIENMVLAGENGWTARMDSARLATRQAEAEAESFAHDLGFRAEGLVPPRTWTDTLDRAGVLPEEIGLVNLDATMVFDRRLDRYAVEDENPRLERVRIRDLSLGWGRLDLRGQGDLVTDAEGYAEGRIDLRARNWREMLEVAVSAGVIGSGMADAVETGLGLLARLSGDTNSIEVPLVFEEGRARLGPVTVGEAPRLAGPQRQ